MNFFSFYLFFFLIGLKFLCLIIINFLVLFCVFSYRNFSGFVNVQKTNQTVFPFKLGILKFKYNLFNNNSNYRKWYHQRVFQNCLLCHKYRDQKQSLGVFFLGLNLHILLSHQNMHTYRLQNVFPIQEFFWGNCPH